MKGDLYLLDTNTVSYVLSGRSEAARQRYLQTTSKSVVALSAITEAEIRFGLERRPEAKQLRSKIEQFLSAIVCLSWDRSVAHTYGKLCAELGGRGKVLAALDLLIAAHALATDAVLVTSDRAFLQLAPSLTVVDWATDL